MPSPTKLSDNQLERVNRLEKNLAKAARQRDLKLAKLCLNDLRPILERHNNTPRLLENYLILYEAALELWELDVARVGFEFVINKSNNGRLRLEAQTLLAITFLRKEDILSAEPHIAAVLRNDKVITSEAKRREFRRETIDRFDQEGAIAALAHLYPEHLDEAKIHEESLKLLREGKFDDELEEQLGASIPESVRQFILKIDQLAKKQLPSSERLMLPGPAEVIKNRRVAGIVFQGISRRLHPHLCDPESEVYKKWIAGGLDSVLGGGFLVGVVIQTMTDARVLIPSAIASMGALVAKRGLNTFCTNHKPRELMSLRRKHSK